VESRGKNLAGMYTDDAIFTAYKSPVPPTRASSESHQRAKETSKDIFP